MALPDFTQFLGNDPVNNTLLQAVAAALDKTAPPASALEPVQTSSFRGQAEGEASAFFDKDLDLAMREINLAREQYKQAKLQQEQFQQEDFGVFKNVQDKNFARALAKAQGKFSGAGTFTSGIRNKAIGEGIADQEQTMSDAERAQQQATAERNLKFQQFFDTSNLDEERTKLNIDRAREGEILARQSQLANQEQTRRSNIVGQSDRNFNRVLSFSNFLNDRLQA